MEIKGLKEKVVVVVVVEKAVEKEKERRWER